MTFEQFLNNYLNFVWNQMQADVWVLSQWWTYVFILPFFFYVAFMFLKWYFIFFPLTFSLTMLSGMFRPWKHRCKHYHHKDL